jgi:choline dehydrogenase
METFDYVIVGAGSAGCILAYRLSESGHSVCVLEAGPMDWNPYIYIPAGIMKTFTNKSITWQMSLTGNDHAGNRQIPSVQGRVVGGSSSINGMVHSRGQAADYDRWAAQGAEGWDYASVLPYFRMYETFTGNGDPQFRGKDGPVRISPIARRDLVSDAFIAGAIETGSPANPDYNGRDQRGVGYTQAAISNGLRWSSARGYLHPARRKFGVELRTRAIARRVLLENGKAVGIEYSRDGEDRPRTVTARKGVVLSAGAIHTPKLLQLSGIGPGDVLRRQGIPVLHELPGVGRNLADHFAARIVMRVRKNVVTINNLARGLPLLGEIAKWMVRRPSIVTMCSMAVYNFDRIDPQSAENDYAITFTPASMKAGGTRELDDFPGVTSGAWQLRPESRGVVEIRSCDFREQPKIAPNYLDAERDRQVLVAGIRRSEAVLKSRAMSHIVEQQILPQTECRTDEEWLAFIRQYGSTGFHYCGTCRMGAATDVNAVVDSRLRVRGLQNLMVVDASVMPTTPSGNTNAATTMIAERAADLIIGRI